MEIVGDASKNVTAETKEKLDQVPWRAIAGTRDRLVHAYFDVDLDQLWQIGSVDLPLLAEALEGATSA